METKPQLLKAIREVARKEGTRSLSLAAFLRANGGGPDRIKRHFASWTAASGAAGLVPNTGTRRLSDDVLFGAMRDAMLKLGGVASRKQIEPHFPFSVTAFRRRGMSWSGTLVALRLWLEKKDPGFPYLDLLPSPADVPSRGPRTWRSVGGPKFGEPLNYRGILHAPTNEMGVVMLFALMAVDLGFVIELAQRDFPDCYAKRHIGRGRWERVRIEFEFLSRNFLEHRHDAKKCEVIVCWEHNWPRCPLEVIELKKEIEKLRKAGKG